MATIRDVAKLAGVSPSTVSRVLNSSGYVNEDTRKNVVTAIEKLDFEPNAVAKGLTSKKTNTLALILPDITNPFFPEFSRAVEDEARAFGYTVILCNSEHNGQVVNSYLDVLKRKLVDGVIMVANDFDSQTMDFFRKTDLPLVIADRSPKDQEERIMIRSKNFEGALMAFRHLQEVGCRKIAHVYGPQHLYPSSARREGYEHLARQYDWYEPSLLVPGNFDLEGGYQAAVSLLAKVPDVDGIFAGNDMMAIGVIKALKKMNIRVPEDIAVCGFDGISAGLICEPELTTIQQPTYEMGKISVRQLVEQMRGAAVTKQRYELEVTLVTRASTLRR